MHTGCWEEYVEDGVKKGKFQKRDIPCPTCRQMKADLANHFSEGPEGPISLKEITKRGPVPPKEEGDEEREHAETGSASSTQDVHPAIREAIRQDEQTDQTGGMSTATLMQMLSKKEKKKKKKVSTSEDEDSCESDDSDESNDSDDSEESDDLDDDDHDKKALGKGSSRKLNFASPAKTDGKGSVEADDPATTRSSTRKRKASTPKKSVASAKKKATRK